MAIGKAKSGSRGFRSRGRQSTLFSSRRLIDALGLGTGQAAKASKEQMRQEAPSRAAYAFRRFKKTGLLENVLTSVPVLGGILNLSPRAMGQAILRANPFVGAAVGAVKFFGERDEEFEKHQKAYTGHQRRLQNLQKAREAKAIKRKQVEDQLNSIEPILRILIDRAITHIDKMSKRTDILSKNKGNLRRVGYTNQHEFATSASKRLSKIERIPNNKNQPSQLTTAKELLPGVVQMAETLERWKSNWEQQGFKKVPKFAKGGQVKGPGTGTSDSVLAQVSTGEYIVSANGVKKIGKDVLDQINKGQIQEIKAPTQSLKDASLTDLLSELKKINLGIAVQSEEEKLQAERQEAAQIEQREEAAELRREQQSWQERLLGAVSGSKTGPKQGKGLLDTLKNFKGIGSLLSSITKYGPLLLTMFKGLFFAGKMLLRNIVPLYAAFQLIQNAIEGFAQGGWLGGIAGLFEGAAEFVAGMFLQLPAQIIDWIFGTDLSGFIETSLMPIVENVGESMLFLFQNIGTILSDIPKILIGMLISAVEKIPGIGALVPDGLKNWANDFSRAKDTGGVTQTKTVTPSPESIPLAATKPAVETSSSSSAVQTVPTSPRVQGLATETTEYNKNMTNIKMTPVVVNAPTTVSSTVGTTGGQTQTPPATPRNNDSTIQRLNQQAYSGAF